MARTRSCSASSSRSRPSICDRETDYLGATGRTARRSASFGIATYPEDATDLEKRLALGDQALFSVKDSGRDGIASAGARV